MKMHIRSDQTSTSSQANNEGVDTKSSQKSSKVTLQKLDGSQKTIKVTRDPPLSPGIKGVALSILKGNNNHDIHSPLNRLVQVVDDPSVSFVGKRCLNPLHEKEMISAEEILKDDAKQSASEILTVTGSENLMESGSEILNKDD
jgi:hypothetical protein